MSLSVYLKRTQKLFTALIFILINISYEVPIAGPYDVFLEQAEPCPAGMLDMPFYLKAHLRRDRKLPRVFYVFANYTTSSTISDDDNVTASFASWSSRGGWKDNAIVMKFKKVCTTFRYHLPLVWDELIRTLTYEPSDGTPSMTTLNCPFAPGYFSNRNASSATADIRGMPVMFYGKWRLDLTAIKSRSSKTFMCVRAFIRTDPKKTNSHRSRKSVRSKPVKT